MYPPQLLFGGLDYTNSSGFGAGFTDFVHDRSMFWQVWAWIAAHREHSGRWLKKPLEYLPLYILKHSRADNCLDVLALVMAWWITFTVVLTLLWTVGFGPVGVGAGMSHLSHLNYPTVSARGP